jgi:hypothetical protein
MRFDMIYLSSIAGEIILLFDLQCKIYKYWIIFCYFLLGQQTVSRQNALPAFRQLALFCIPGLASWILVRSGFKVNYV